MKDRGKVVGVLADGHYLFRAVEKILHMEPMTVMKEAKAHMISRPSDKRFYASETEIATRVTRYTEFEIVKHNGRGPDSIHAAAWGGTEDCQIIASWYKRDVAILHTKQIGGLWYHVHTTK